MIKFLAKNQILKRIIITILLTMQMLTFFAFDTNEDIYADSNSLRRAYLDLMNGRNETEMSVDSMSMDDLKMIALYLSNFYQIYGTALDNADDDYYKDNCVTALVQIGYSKDMATKLVDYIYDMNLSTATPLYFDLDDYTDLRAVTTYPSRLGFGDDSYDPGLDFNELTEAYMDYFGMDDNSSIPLTLFDYYCILDTYTRAEDLVVSILGSVYSYNCARQEYPYARCDENYEPIEPIYVDKGDGTYTCYCSDEYIDALNKCYKEYNLNISGDFTYDQLLIWLKMFAPDKYVYVEWNDDHTSYTWEEDYIDNYPAISWDDKFPLYYLDSEGNKCDCFYFNLQVATYLGTLLRNSDTSNGQVGNALFNITGYTEDGGIDEMSDSEIFASTVFFQQMYVDWVGNILCDFGDKRVIVVPACANPFVFQSLTPEKQKD